MFKGKRGKRGKREKKGEKYEGSTVTGGDGDGEMKREKNIRG